MSLGLKLYYLRTRVKKVTQTVMARELKIRQATISNVEQGLSQPSLPLLRTLSEYFDVTPTYLLDEDGPIELTATDRWSNRRGLATAGQFLEVPKSAIHELDGDSSLVAMLPGTPVYDEAAARARATRNEADLAQAHRGEIARRTEMERELRSELETERYASRLRRRGGKAFAAAKAGGEI